MTPSFKGLHGVLDMLGHSSMAAHVSLWSCCNDAAGMCNVPSTSPRGAPHQELASAVCATLKIPGLVKEVWGMLRASHSCSSRRLANCNRCF